LSLAFSASSALIRPRASASSAVRLATCASKALVAAAWHDGGRVREHINLKKSASPDAKHSHDAQKRPRESALREQQQHRARCGARELLPVQWQRRRGLPQRQEQEQEQGGEKLRRCFLLTARESGEPRPRVPLPRQTVLLREKGPGTSSSGWHYGQRTNLQRQVRACLRMCLGRCHPGRTRTTVEHRQGRLGEIDNKQGEIKAAERDRHAVPCEGQQTRAARQSPQ
jgi:hypothetical protein